MKTFGTERLERRRQTHSRTAKQCAHLARYEVGNDNC